MAVLDRIYFRPKRRRKRIRLTAKKLASIKEAKRLECQEKEIAVLEKKRRPKVYKPLKLFLASRQILILRKHRRRRRKLTSLIRRKDSRTPLDLPTTDPGGDLFFSSDDEFEDADGSPSGSTLPKPRKYLLHSELQRKYMDQYSDGTLSPGMPPELIVKGANQIGSTKKSSEEQNPLICFNLSTATQCVPRTGSYGNLRKLSNNAKQGAPKNFRTEFKDKLDSENSFMRNKLVQKYQNDSSSFNDGTSWYVPPPSRIEDSKKMSTRETLVAACTQKLLAWQQIMTGSNLHSNVVVNDICPELLQKKELANRQRKMKPLMKIASDMKSRKKKSSLTSTASNSKPNANNSKLRNPSINGVPLIPLPARSSGHIPSKFKTGAIVTTVVRPSKKIKRMKVNSTVEAKPSITELSGNKISDNGTTDNVKKRDPNRTH